MTLLSPQATCPCLPAVRSVGVMDPFFPPSIFATIRMDACPVYFLGELRFVALGRGVWEVSVRRGADLLDVL